MKIRLLKPYVCKGGGLTVFLLFGLISICQSIPTSGTQRIARDVAGVTSETSDLVGKIRESTAKGMGVAKELVEEASTCIAGLVNTIRLIHDEMKALEEVTVTFDDRALDLSQKYYHEFYPIKGNLRKTRLGLKKLAKETVLMSKKMQIFFNNAERLGDKKALELQMTTLERFLIKSIPILREAETEYKSALTKLENFEPMMHTFLVELNKEVRETGQKIKDLEDDKREKEDEAVVLDIEIRQTRQNIMDLENDKERKEGSVAELNRRITANEGEINSAQAGKAAIIGVAATGSVAMVVLDIFGCLGKFFGSS